MVFATFRRAGSRRVLGATRGPHPATAPSRPFRTAADGRRARRAGPAGSRWRFSLASALPRIVRWRATGSPTWCGPAGASRRTGRFARSSYDCAARSARTRFPRAGQCSQPVRLDSRTDRHRRRPVPLRRRPSGGASEALALYRGPLLEGFPLRPKEPLGEWFGGHRERLRDIARALMLRLLRVGRGQPGARRAADRARSAVRGGLPVSDPARRGRGRPCRRAAALRGVREALSAAGLETSLEIRALMDDARAEIARSSANAFQVALPASAAQTTQWLRAALGQAAPVRGPLRKPCRRSPTVPRSPSCRSTTFRSRSARDPYLGDFVTEELTASLSRVRRAFRLFAPFRLRLSGGREGRARHRGRTRRALSGRRRDLAKRGRAALQRRA